MYKIIVFFTLFTHLLFSATSEQVDQYMSLSHTDRTLIEIENMFSYLDENMETSDENTAQEITLAYQIYLGKHISEDEMEKVLDFYRKPVIKHYINEMDTIEIPAEEMSNFLISLEETPLTTERQDVIDELLKSLINEELLINFYNSMMQRYQVNDENKQAKGKEKNTSKQEKQFVEVMKEGIKQELLYGTQVLSLEEIKKVNKLINSSVIKKVKSVENKALIEIMNGFIKRITSKPKVLEKK